MNCFPYLLLENCVNFNYFTCKTIVWKLYQMWQLVQHYENLVCQQIK